MSDDRIEHLLRSSAPQVLGAVVRRFGNFDCAEDATQEALLAAALQWPVDGVPDNPLGWLITVASRRLTDLLRARQARMRREARHSAWMLPARQASPADQGPDAADDTVILLFLCCHPALSAASQIALTLRAVGGLSTPEVARALVASEATVTRRITRAKQTIRDHGATFALPDELDLEARTQAVLHVLYLIFNEGYASTGGASLQRVELADEAIRLTRCMRAAAPNDSELAGLLALMLLTDARRDARTGPNGELIPMDEQDRSRWRQDQIAEGIALITDALPRGPVGPYQVQAAIAALHDEARSSRETDWPQIVQLYELLLRIVDSPVTALNHAVAVAMRDGPAAGLDLIERDRRMDGDHRYHAVRGHLLERVGDREAAASSFERAADRASNLQQRRYLFAQARRLGGCDERA